MSAEAQSELKNIAESLKSLIDNILISQNDLNYTQDPEITERDIIEYESRMRVRGMEKFNAPCYVAATNFYKTQQDLEAHNALGALIIYVEQENAEKLIKALGYKIKNDDDEDEVLPNYSGEFCKTLGEELIKKIGGNYSSSVLSEPIIGLNTIAEGVEFNYNQYQMYELTFYLWKVKILSVDITLGE